MYKDADGTLAYGKNGRRFVERNFSADVCTGLYEEIFRSILSKRGKEQ
jgi:hypothetical protein